MITLHRGRHRPRRGRKPARDLVLLLTAESAERSLERLDQSVAKSHELVKQILDNLDTKDEQEEINRIKRAGAWG